MPVMTSWQRRTTPELAKAYHAVSSAKQAAGEEEKAFARRLQSAAILAGSVLDKSNLKSIYVEGLHQHLQSDVRLHITSKMTLEEVMHVAQTVGESKRHALSLLPLALAKVRTPTKVKPLLRNVAAVHSVEDTELESAESSEVQHLREELQVALAATHGPYRHESSGASPWSPGSSATIVASFPTRGCTSPDASVTSRYPVDPPGMMALLRGRTP
jgi:hypothetical protein